MCEVRGYESRSEKGVRNFPITAGGCLHSLLSMVALQWLLGQANREYQPVARRKQRTARGTAEKGQGGSSDPRRIDSKGFGQARRIGPGANEGDRFREPGAHEGNH